MFAISPRATQQVSPSLPNTLGALPPGTRPWSACTALAIASLAGVVFLGSCGTSDNEFGALKIARPTTPSASQCGAVAESGQGRPEKPPLPGTYDYRARGHRVLIGNDRRVFQLPHTIQVVVSPTRRVGRLVCFALQRRFGEDLADTGIFVIRGNDVYLRAVRFQSGSYINAFAPNPAILSLSGSELSWSGTFRGSAVGRYAAELIGRKTIRVGSRSVRAVGIRSRASYAGSLRGWDRSVQWFAPARHLIVAERSTQQRTLGLDRLRLSYSARLTSLSSR